MSGVDEKLTDEVCRSYRNRGRCRFGEACKFLHTEGDPIPTPKGEMKPRKICLNFSEGKVCEFGDKCRFFHGTPAEAAAELEERQKRGDAGRRSRRRKKTDSADAGDAPADSKTKKVTKKEFNAAGVEICNAFKKKGKCRFGSACTWAHEGYIAGTADATEAKEKKKARRRNPRRTTKYYQGVPIHKLSQPTDDTKENVIIVSCGSFSPVSYLHLRIFEAAKNALSMKYNVVGGVMSPVHDAYGKSSLVDAKHRLEMCRRSVRTSDWIAVCDWECEQEGYSPTLGVLKTYEKLYNESKVFDKPVQLRFLCGSDLVASFATPAWKVEDVVGICKIGIVAIEREGYPTLEIIESNEVLKENSARIDSLKQRCDNSVSSTAIRYLIGFNASIKYLTPDAVIAYITQNHLYIAERSPPEEAKAPALIRQISRF